MIERLCAIVFFTILNSIDSLELYHNGLIFNIGCFGVITDVHKMKWLAMDDGLDFCDGFVLMWVEGVGEESGEIGGRGYHGFKD